MKHCKKCNKNYSETDSYCEECGGKLIKLIEAKEDEPKSEKKIKAIQPKTHEPKRIPTKTFIFAIIFFIGILLLCGILIGHANQTFNQNAGNTQNVYSPNSPSQNCRQVQEPYTVQVPYQYTFQYSSPGWTCNSDWSISLGFFYKCVIKITNKENEGGQFSANFNMASSTKKQYTDTITNYIASLSTQDFETVFDTSMGESLNGTVTITPPVTTKYRDETQYRTVTKCD